MPDANDSEAARRAAPLREFGKLGAVDKVGELARSLDDPYADVRAAAIEALSTMGIVAAGPRIADLLEDRDASVRERAGAGLGALGLDEYAERIAGRLDDPDERVRARCVLELGRLGAKEVQDRMAARLGDPSPSVRRGAALGLGALARIPPSSGEIRSWSLRLSEVERGGDAETAVAASISLIRLGAKSVPEQRAIVENVRSLGEAGWGLFRLELTAALDQMHEPEATYRLSETVQLKRPVESSRRLADMLLEAGFTLEWTGEERLPTRLPAGIARPIRRMLENVSGDRGVVLAASTVRMLPRLGALDAWIRRLG